MTLESDSRTVAGDHHIVAGRVRHPELDTPEPPLNFSQRGYGGFAADRPPA